jgi:hypothetical protein
MAVALAFFAGCKENPTPSRDSSAGAPTSSAGMATTGEIDLDDVDLPPSIRKDWLEKDLDLLERFGAVFPLESAAKAFEALDGEGSVCVKQALGFDVERRHCRIGGGYTTCTLLTITHADELMEAKASCRSSEKKWTQIAPVIESAHHKLLAPKGFDRKRHIATQIIEKADAHAAATAAVADTLGPASGADIPSELAEPYARLTEPRSSLTLGTHCGYAGTPPEGHRAMRALVDAERDDLLRDALRGLNPGGRLYGYVGLKLLGKNTAEDDATYDRVTALDVEIETCGGCMLNRQKAADIDLTGFRKQ